MGSQDYRYNSEVFVIYYDSVIETSLTFSRTKYANLCVCNLALIS